jgi:hypothetical protein
MVRTVISLTDEDKDWLDRRAQEEGVPMTQLVRRAVVLLREQMEKDPPTFEQLLESTKDVWPNEDGLDYQRKMRNEW